MITKKDEYSIEESTQKPLPPPDVNVYDYGFLLNQKIQIEKDIANMQKELNKVNTLTLEATKSGVTEKIAEEII